MPALGGELPDRFRCWRGGNGRSIFAEDWPRAVGRAPGRAAVQVAIKYAETERPTTQRPLGARDDGGRYPSLA